MGRAKPGWVMAAIMHVSVNRAFNYRRAVRVEAPVGVSWTLAAANAEPGIQSSREGGLKKNKISIL